MCPECKRPLVVFELQGIEIDHCLHCFGIWLDAGELEHLDELTGTPSGRLSRALADARSGVASTRLCPRCRRRLRTLRLDHGAPIELEECPLGHGLWFDRGEIRQLVDTCAQDSEEGTLAAFFAELFHAELASASPGPAALPANDPPRRDP